MCQRPEREVQLRYALCASSLNRKPAASRASQGLTIETSVQAV